MSQMDNFSKWSIVLIISITIGILMHISSVTLFNKKWINSPEYTTREHIIYNKNSIIKKTFNLERTLDKRETAELFSTIMTADILKSNFEKKYILWHSANKYYLILTAGFALSIFLSYLILRKK